MVRALRSLSVMTSFAVALSLLSSQAVAIDTADTRLLSAPAITEGRIAFVYGDDIWVAAADGSSPRRITSHAGAEQNPYFSPDGRHHRVHGELRREC